MSEKQFPRDSQLFAGWEYVPWPDCLTAEVRRKKAEDALRRWSQIPDLLFTWAVIFLIELQGGQEWVHRHPRLLQELDDVFHCRGFRIEAGWKPPRYVQYGDALLCLDESEVADLMCGATR